MVIQRSVERLSPIMIQPKHDPDQMKTPTQQKLEIESGVRNLKSKKIAEQATQKVYEMLQRVAKNTEVNISMRIDELGGNEQFNVIAKKDGKLLVSLPPDVAVEMAKRSKQTTIGLLFDISA